MNETPLMFELLESDDDDAPMIDYSQMVPHSDDELDDGLATQPLFLLGLDSQLPPPWADTQLETETQAVAIESVTNVGQNEPRVADEAEPPSSQMAPIEPNIQPIRRRRSTKKTDKKKMATFNVKLNGSWHVITSKDIETLELLDSILVRISELARQKGPSGNMRPLINELARVETVLARLCEEDLIETLPQELWSEMLHATYRAFYNTQVLIQRCKMEPTDETEELSQNLSQHLVFSDEDDGLIPPTPKGTSSQVKKSSTLARRPSQKRKGSTQPPVVASKNPNPTHVNAAEATASDSDAMINGSQLIFDDIQPPSQLQPKKSRVQNNRTHSKNRGKSCDETWTPHSSTTKQKASQKSRKEIKKPRGRPTLSRKNGNVLTANVVRDAATQGDQVSLGASAAYCPVQSLPVLAATVETCPTSTSTQSTPEIARNIPFPPEGNDRILSSYNDPFEAEISSSPDLLSLWSQQPNEAHIPSAPHPEIPVISESLNNNDTSEPVQADPPPTQTRQPVEPHIIFESQLVEPNSQMDRPAQMSQSVAQDHDLTRKIAKCNFSLLPFIQRGVLQEGKDNIVLHAKNAVYVGCLNANGTIGVNGSSFPSIGHWIRSVYKETYLRLRLAEQKTIWIEYDGSNLGEIINRSLENPILGVASVRKTPTFQEYPSSQSQRNIARRKPLQTIQPHEELNRTVQPANEPTQTANPCQESPEELQPVPEEMLRHITKILLHPPSEWYRSCQCEDDMWAGRRPLSKKLLDELSNW